MEIKEFYPRRNREKGLIGNVWSKKVFFVFWVFFGDTLASLYVEGNSAVKRQNR